MDLDLDHFGPSFIMFHHVSSCFIMFHQLLHGEVASLKRASNSGGKGYPVNIQNNIFLLPRYSPINPITDPSGGSFCPEKRSYLSQEAGVE